MFFHKTRRLETTDRYYPDSDIRSFSYVISFRPNLKCCLMLSTHTCWKLHLHLGHLPWLSGLCVPPQRAGESTLLLERRPENAGSPEPPGSKRRTSSETLDLYQATKRGKGHILTHVAYWQRQEQTPKMKKTKFRFLVYTFWKWLHYEHKINIC